MVRLFSSSIGMRLILAASLFASQGLAPFAYAQAGAETLRPEGAGVSASGQATVAAALPTGPAPAGSMAAVGEQIQEEWRGTANILSSLNRAWNTIRKDLYALNRLGLLVQRGEGGEALSPEQTVVTEGGAYRLSDQAATMWAKLQQLLAPLGYRNSRGDTDAIHERVQTLINRAEWAEQFKALKEPLSPAQLEAFAWGDAPQVVLVTPEAFHAEDMALAIDETLQQLADYMGLSVEKAVRVANLKFVFWDPAVETQADAEKKLGSLINELSGIDDAKVRAAKIGLDRKWFTAVVSGPQANLSESIARGVRGADLPWIRRWLKLTAEKGLRTNRLFGSFTGATEDIGGSKGRGGATGLGVIRGLFEAYRLETGQENLERFPEGFSAAVEGAGNVGEGSIRAGLDLGLSFKAVSDGEFDAARGVFIPHAIVADEPMSREATEALLAYKAQHRTLRGFENTPNGIAAGARFIEGYPAGYDDIKIAVSATENAGERAIRMVEADEVFPNAADGGHDTIATTRVAVIALRPLDQEALAAIRTYYDTNGTLRGIENTEAGQQHGFKVVAELEKLIQFNGMVVDAFIPAAGENTIGRNEALMAKYKYQAEGANGPTTEAGDEILNEKEVAVVPDLLANNGGVTVSYWESLQNARGQYLDEATINDLLREHFKQNTAALYKIKADNPGLNLSNRQAAVLLALQRLLFELDEAGNVLTDEAGGPVFLERQSPSAENTAIVRNIVDKARSGAELNNGERMYHKFYSDIASALELLNQAMPGLGLTIDSPQVQALLVPARVIDIEFQVGMDDGSRLTFEGWRIQHDNARGPFKGGIRFFRDLLRETIMALSSEMTWKTAVANIPLGGGKGGVNLVAVDDQGNKVTRSYSPAETERIIRAWTRAVLQQVWNEEGVVAIGFDWDVPAPDVNTYPALMDAAVDEYMQWLAENSRAMQWVKENSAAFTVGGVFADIAANIPAAQGEFEALERLAREDATDEPIAIVAAIGSKEQARALAEDAAVVGAVKTPESAGYDAAKVQSGAALLQHGLAVAVGEETPLPDVPGEDDWLFAPEFDVLDGLSNSIHAMRQAAAAA